MAGTIYEFPLQVIKQWKEETPATTTKFQSSLLSNE